MIQLSVRSGRQAGEVLPVGRFPVTIGRGTRCGIRLVDDGVWETHAEIELAMPDGFILRSTAEAPTLVNGEAVARTPLKNGDLLTLGAASFRFGLAPTRPAGTRLREALTWVALGALCLGQVAIVYLLRG